jgi:GNAT superfamily N-acetyltransferase
MNTAATIRLTSAHKNDLEALRYSTLLNEGTFTARPEVLQWSADDERAVIFGIYSPEQKLLSSMRVEIIESAEALVPKLDFEGLESHIDLPCGLLGKASTLPEYRGHGFNTYLRYLAYQYFHEQGIRHVVGTVMPEAPRLNLLRSLGYVFLENPEGWRRHGYQSFGKTWVCYLDLEKNYPAIIAKLELQVKTLKEIYPLQ